MSVSEGTEVQKKMNVYYYDKYLALPLNLKKCKPPPDDKTKEIACAPSKDSDKPGHPPSLIRVFAVRSMGS